MHRIYLYYYQSLHLANPAYFTTTTTKMWNFLDKISNFPHIFFQILLLNIFFFHLKLNTFGLIRTEQRNFNGVHPQNNNNNGKIKKKKTTSNKQKFTDLIANYNES